MLAKNTLEVGEHMEFGSVRNQHVLVRGQKFGQIKTILLDEFGVVFDAVFGNIKP